ncbi:MAG TPA: sigma-70 family RNA polymerase sigma factor [Humisphaera sp.]
MTNPEPACVTAQPPPPPPPDADVAARLYDLLSSLRAKMEAYARRQIPPRLRSAIDPLDAVQDACEAAVRRMHTLDWRTPDAGERWVMTILRNRIVDVVRSGGADRRRASLADLGEGDLAVALADVAVYERTPSRSAADRERAERLRAAVAGLPEPYRSVVRARFVEQRPAADVAAATGRTADGVHKACSRGLSMLREALAADAPPGR